MTRNLSAALAGVLFGIGLTVSGMTSPAKVQGFLDVTGKWDQSLLWVMVGAIAVHLPLYRLLTRRTRPLQDTKFHVPNNRTLDGRLVIGASIFGVGWGLGGYCPGPAIASAFSGLNSAVVLVAIVVGILVHELTFGALARRRAPAESAPPQNADPTHVPREQS